MVDPFDVWVPEVRLLHQHAEVRIGIEFATVPIANVAIVPKDFCPFGCFQRNAVCSCESCAYEADAIARRAMHVAEEP